MQRKLVPIEEQAPRNESVSSSDVVQKVWNYCDVLRDDEMTYGDVEQLTYLLFFKMADQQSKLLLNKLPTIPKNLVWQSPSLKRWRQAQLRFSFTFRVHQNYFERVSN